MYVVDVPGGSAGRRTILVYQPGEPGASGVEAAVTSFLLVILSSNPSMPSEVSDWSVRPSIETPLRITCLPVGSWSWFPTTVSQGKLLVPPPLVVLPATP